MNRESIIETIRNPGMAVAVVLALLAAGFVVTRSAGDPSGAAEASNESIDNESDRGRGGNHEPSRNAYDQGVGFVVPYRPDCPNGSERVGAEPPDGFKEWCERTGRDQGIKHGWYAEWFPDGRPSVAGGYVNGLKVGVWTRWHETGGKRVQAQFEHGLQHGTLISWDENGNELGKKMFRQGVALAN